MESALEHDEALAQEYNDVIIRIASKQEPRIGQEVADFWEEIITDNYKTQ